ncbi:unnamed protein product [Mytilus edulis]|uniref:Endonuclease/exonuclease/phosphatase domain-containing protein n=1 Tax=Mytilus edulis TaxID=6550 RepID=A0A8S3UAA5_MYTED|nr:unnamed protein product [Mytilus edulis]
MQYLLGIFIPNKPSKPDTLTVDRNTVGESVNIVYSNSTVRKNSIRILSFNCKNVLSCGPFFEEAYNHMDICLLQEHWLFNCQIDNLNELHEHLNGIGKSVDDRDPITPVQMPRGYGGVGILWRKEMDSLITTLDIGNERIQCVEVRGDKKKLLLVSVYLPCRGSNNNISELQECVDILYEIVQSFSGTHCILVGGDFNENIFIKSGLTRNQYILDFMEECKFSAKEIGKTFIHSNGVDSTAIDHILYPDLLQDDILYVKKLDIINNVSDHYPIQAEINFEFSIGSNELKSSKRGKIYCKVNWDKLDKDKYQESIEKGIDALKLDLNTTDGISDAFSNINNIIDSATKSVAPAHKAFRKRPKLKVMNENIDHAIKAKKQAHALWKFQGRPADPCNELVINKKQTTYELRKQCRNEIAQRRINDREEIIQARVMDNKLFHKLISRQRGKLGKLIDELHVDQSSYSETNILEGWRIHFSNLAKKSNTSKFDIQYLDTVDSEYEHIIKICTDEREHNKQNPLQRGFTENSAPLIATLMIDEFERENKDLKKTTILGMLDAKLFDDMDLDLNGELMPVVDKTPHIGIQRAFKDSASATIEENLKKARRSLYSLMASGLHGENGLDPVTAISLVKTYILPVMLYGLETLLPSGKNLDLISKQYKKMLKQILSLTTNVADPAVYIISGQLPAEAEIHKRAFTLFGNICRSGNTSMEWRIAERQLSIKNMKSNSWFIEIKKALPEI